MKKIVAGIVLAGLVAMPMAGRAAEVKIDASISERANQSVAEAEAALQKALKVQEVAVKVADEAAAALDKSQADLKIAQSTGDKEKIKAAQGAMIKAKIDSETKSQKLKKVNALVDRLRAILDKAREAAAAVASAKTPAEAKVAMAKLDSLVQQATVVATTVEQTMKPKPPVTEPPPGCKVPPTTTSTTLPSPTQVGQIRG